MATSNHKIYPSQKALCELSAKAPDQGEEAFHGNIDDGN
jgi:hypothetical protein